MTNTCALHIRLTRLYGPLRVCDACVRLSKVSSVQFSSMLYIFYRALLGRHEEGLREHCSDNVVVCLSVRVWVCASHCGKRCGRGWSTDEITIQRKRNVVVTVGACHNRQVDLDWFLTQWRLSFLKTRGMDGEREMKQRKINAKITYQLDPIAKHPW
jgi:hypothetical protein